ncbi:hypothetical protein MLD38_027337 [Melastoma candidum]|uniref:Uncharacterized protein n=1 Tax=Melastoma candidum TaxID=119954 RepID=A0ACB9P478_9MYRT|nr:hypothetical protein MLD38_027337 [Melastoma candidum]
MAQAAYTVASDSENTGEGNTSMTFPEIAIGIDVGTSHCSVAVWNGSEVEILRNARNQKMMRSYVLFKDDTPSGGVSSQLSHEQEITSGSAIFNVKRLIGRVDSDPVVQSCKTLPFLVQTLDVGTRPFIAALVNDVWRSTTPEEVIAISLVELKALAEVQLKRPVRDVVLTVPASFSRFQLARVEQSCAMAGLRVLRLMPEPTAVALLYAQQQQQSVDDNQGSVSEKIALIFSMGAGYSDVAISATAGGVSQIKALAGCAIGGEDLLQNTIRYLLPPDSKHLLLTQTINEIRSMGLLRLATQEAIHKLSSDTSAQVNFDLGDGKTIHKVITREEFESVNRDAFEKCKALVRQCLHDAKVDVENVDDVILVGGCSRIPWVTNMVTETLKKGEIYKGMNPLEAAVIGVALEGAVASGINDPFGSLDLLTIQATPLAVGIRASGDNFVPVIPRNTTIPTRKDVFFTTVRDNQSEALIIVYEGEGEKVGENHLLGYFKIAGIPPAAKGVPEINVCMDIDASNTLRVLAGVLLPGSRQPTGPIMEVRMPTVDDSHGLCADALNRTYGTSLDLVTLKKAA